MCSCCIYYSNFESTSGTKNNNTRKGRNKYCNFKIWLYRQMINDQQEFIIFRLLEKKHLTSYFVFFLSTFVIQTLPPPWSSVCLWTHHGHNSETSAAFRWCRIVQHSDSGTQARAAKKHPVREHKSHMCVLGHEFGWVCTEHQISTSRGAPANAVLIVTWVYACVSLEQWWRTF